MQTYMRIIKRKIMNLTKRVIQILHYLNIVFIRYHYIFHISIIF
jgi:hypothetical protein